MDNDDTQLPLTELNAKIWKLERYMGRLNGKIQKREADLLRIKSKNTDTQKVVKMGLKLIDPEGQKGIQT